MTTFNLKKKKSLHYLDKWSEKHNILLRKAWLLLISVVPNVNGILNEVSLLLEHNPEPLSSLWLHIGWYIQQAFSSVKNWSQIPCKCTHIWPMSLTLILVHTFYLTEFAKSDALYKNDIQSSRKKPRHMYFCKLKLFTSNTKLIYLFLLIPFFSDKW